jgi:hypothetical protein
MVICFLATTTPHLSPAELTPFLRVISASLGTPGRVACKDIDLSMQLKKDGLSPDGGAPLAWANSGNQIKGYLAGGNRLVVCGEENGLKEGASIAIFKENGKPVLVVSIKNATANGFTLSDALLKIATRK